MKNNYKEPAIEIVALPKEDAIMASGNVLSGGENGGQLPEGW